MEENGHRQRGNLPFRDGVVTNPVDKETNFFITQRVAITFFANNFLSEKQGTLLINQVKCSELAPALRSCSPAKRSAAGEIPESARMRLVRATIMH